MCEIVLLWALCRAIGVTVENKGLPRLPFQLMLVLFWFAGEVAGFVAGAMMMVTLGGEGGPELLLYVFALIGAALGAGLAFFIANLLPDGRRDLSPYGGCRDTGAGGWVGREDRDRIRCRDCGFRYLTVLDACPKCGPR